MSIEVGGGGRLVDPVEVGARVRVAKGYGRLLGTVLAIHQGRYGVLSDGPYGQGDLRWQSRGEIEEA